MRKRIAIWRSRKTTWKKTLITAPLIMTLRKRSKQQGRHLWQKTMSSVGPHFHLQLQWSRKYHSNDSRTHKTGYFPCTWHSVNISALPPFSHWKKIGTEMTNKEGIKQYGQEWKTMDVTHLHAYKGLLILAGMYRSQSEAASILWNQYFVPLSHWNCSVPYRLCSELIIIRQDH